MKNNTTILTILTYAILLSSSVVLLSDVREFILERNESFLLWAQKTQKGEHWFNSENGLKWSYYTINGALFFLRGYLIYGFSYFLRILGEIEKGQYFSEKNITAFKQMGTICIHYVISVLILRTVLASLEQKRFHLFHEYKEELTLLVPCGLAFYILAEIFSQAKRLKDENDLTV